MNWVIAANSTDCKIYEHSKKPRALKLIEEIHFPSGREKGIDLISDKPGHYGTPFTTRGAFNYRTDPKETEHEKLAILIANKIKHGQAQSLIDYLIMFAPAHLLGKINNHMNGHLENFATLIPKDYVYLPKEELLNIVGPFEIGKPHKHPPYKLPPTPAL